MAQGVVNIIREWLFGPPVVIEEKPCMNCEMLQEQLAFANYDRKMLLEHFVRASMPRDEKQEPIDENELQPIRTGLGKFKPWRVRQQELEAQSRQRANMLKPEPRTDAPRVVTPESIEKLESELGLKEGNNAATQEAVR